MAGAADDDTMALDAVEGPNVFASYDVGKTRFEVRARPAPGARTR
jgi:hypothetical protein